MRQLYRSLPSWLQMFLKKIITKPASVKVTDEELTRSSFLVLTILFYGTLGFISVLLALLLISFLLLQNTYVLSRIIVGVILFVYVAIGFWRLKAGNEKFAALVLLVLYGFIATLAVALWSISVPFGLLVFAFVIILAGITLGPRYTLVAAGVSVSVLLLVQLSVEFELLNPDRSRIVVPPSIADVANFGTAFLIIAFVSWISGRQLRGSLARALTAEDALKKEKENLSLRLAERTRKLRSAQLQEMQQLYRFAELGQLSTALLHDLANHLTVLTLDIEDIDKRRHSQAIARAKQSIFYLDKMVDQVRGQLQEGSHIRTFGVANTIQEVIDHVALRAQKRSVKIDLELSKNSRLIKASGDVTRFRQVMTILLSNSIEAYEGSDLKGEKRRIVATVGIERRTIYITVKDWGVGIPAKNRTKLFKPFYSTKAEGMGIGLFIAKQMIETHFKGSLMLNPNSDTTEFIITLKAD